MMRDGRQTERPDTSKNGLMKKRQLALKDESIKQRGQQVLGRLGKKQPKE
ncbi:hypothetical protein P4U99_15310 [Brevibacillus agri]|nr:MULTISPECIES: hypothetical protein [Brevibacillus]MBY0052033.1 hypothetical protein [Brevibacillus agri]MCG5252047.1 hypothetical protein [Brevibacillus agri]MDN4095539.1 hypothetical protein [Brevibacillus agri]MDR9503866.1 hypothetical protein [Brevibacillus agri]MED1644536.1 hypothetical protein [Brevibacillus agri]